MGSYENTSAVNVHSMKRALSAAGLISLASLVQFQILTNGFILTLAVVVMGVFIYCYKDVSGSMIAWVAGICSPLFRFAVLSAGTGFQYSNVIAAAPDIAFYLGYGIIYKAAYCFILKKEKTLRTFPVVILFCDFGGNLCEMLARSALVGGMLINTDIVSKLIAIAVLRTAIIQTINIGVEYYSCVILKIERYETLRRFFSLASVLENELHMMRRNMTEIETIMKSAYGLYTSLSEKDVSKEDKEVALKIAKGVHEIKGDYRSVINILEDNYITEFQHSRMAFSEIVLHEKNNALALAKSKSKEIFIYTEINDDCEISDPFKMMSVIRNVLTNSIEAIENKNGEIVVSSKAIEQNSHPYLQIEIRDNGRGIENSNLEFAELAGYSTKFDERTGNIQRGFGLTIVKDIIENVFGGTLCLESTEGKGTTVRILVDREKVKRA